MRRAVRALLRGGIWWFVLVAIVTAGLWATRDHLDKAHAALVYLLVVLGGSARQGRTVGLALAVLCFLCFNFFLLPPYHTFIIADPLDWLVLVVFLITGAVAAQQLYRVQQEADAARRRAEEIDRLSALGAETLNAARAEDAVQAIAEMIRTTLGVGSCEVHLHADDGFRRLARAADAPQRPEGTARADELYALVVETGAVAVERTGGSSHVTSRPGDTLSRVLEENPDARVVAFPLRVRGRAVGVLRIADRGVLRLTDPQRRFAEALAYYAALGVERVRLSAEAAHAEALREADRLKDALLASVSHDLRTPLTTIKALAHDMRVDGDARAAVVEEEADRLNRFVSDLLDLSRLNSGAVRMDVEINAAEDLVGAALQQSAGVCGDHEVQVRLPPGDEILVGRFDLPHALRALVNLIENACKYSPPGAPVELDVAWEDGFLAFRVADRGPGVPPDERVRIFEPFYRASDAAAVGGTGLGLSIARRFAEAQGGSLRHEPRSGGGSVFTMLLPAARLEPPLSS